MSVRGWVYIISNKAMTGLVKVGFSTKDPNLRALELNHTGAPHPYSVEYDLIVENPYQVEQLAHKLLSEVREGKEWFRCSVDEARSAIIKATGEKVFIENIMRNGDYAVNNLSSSQTTISPNHQLISTEHESIIAEKSAPTIHDLINAFATLDLEFLNKVWSEINNSWRNKSVVGCPANITAAIEEAMNNVWNEQLPGQYDEFNQSKQKEVLKIIATFQQKYCLWENFEIDKMLMNSIPKLIDRMNIEELYDYFEWIYFLFKSSQCSAFIVSKMHLRSITTNEMLTTGMACYISGDVEKAKLIFETYLPRCRDEFTLNTKYYNTNKKLNMSLAIMCAFFLQDGEGKTKSPPEYFVNLVKDFVSQFGGREHFRGCAIGSMHDYILRGVAIGYEQYSNQLENDLSPICWMQEQYS